MGREPKAEVEISAHSRGLAANLRAARAKFGNFGSELKKRVFGKNLTSGFFGKAGSSMVGNLGAKGVSGLVGMFESAGRETFAFEDQLNRLQIAANKTPEEMQAFGKAIRETSSTVGVSAAEILQGAQAYVALTGDMDGAQQAMSSFARIAQASGTSVADVADATAALKTSMALDSKDIEAAFSGLITQGKAGAVELSNLAREMPETLAQFAQFRGAKSLGGIAEMGAAFQVIRKGAGTASTAATQFQAVMGELADKQVLKKLGRAGVKVFDEKGMRSASDIFHDIAKNQKLADPRAIADIFGRKESQQAIRSMREYIGLFDELRDGFKDSGAVQRDLDARLQSSAGRTQVAMERAKNKMAEMFTPERIELFTRGLETAVGLLGDITSGIESVGKALTLALSGPENRFEGELKAARLKRLGIAGTWNDDDMTPSERALRRNATGYDQAVSGFTSLEKNGRSTNESARAAYIASKGQGGFEVAGAREAGDKYLRASNMTPEAVGAQWAKDLMASNERALKLQADAIRELARSLGKAVDRPAKINADGRVLGEVTRNSRRIVSRPGG